MDIAHEMLMTLNDDPGLPKNFITGNESWEYENDVETKVQSSQWKYPEEPWSIKARQVLSDKEVLLNAFLDCNGVVHHEFLRKSPTANKEYYLEVRPRLREEIR